MSIEKTKPDATKGIDPSDDLKSIELTSDGGQKVESIELIDIMTDVLKELKIMNLQLSLMTDTDIKQTEVE